ncbi:unnamed protein product, partial [Rotaria sp. Silwood2]
MVTNSKDLTYIDFNNDWKCYCQQSNDKTDEKTIVTTANNNNIDQYWSPIELPHIIDRIKYNKRPCKWWYRKHFDWISINEQYEQQVYLNFESLNTYDKQSNTHAIIWLNSVQIFSGSLVSLNDPIELSSKLLHNETKHHNILVICCINTNLFLHVCLLIYGQIVCATGQVIIDERPLNEYKNSDEISNDIFDYTASVDDGDGRINVTFNTKRKSIVSSIPLKHFSQSIIN